MMMIVKLITDVPSNRRATVIVRVRIIVPITELRPGRRGLRSRQAIMHYAIFGLSITRLLFVAD